VGNTSEFPFNEVVVIKVYGGKASVQSGGAGSKRDMVVVDNKWEPEHVGHRLTLKGNPDETAIIIIPPNSYMKLWDEQSSDRP